MRFAGGLGDECRRIRLRFGQPYQHIARLCSAAHDPLSWLAGAIDNDWRKRAAPRVLAGGVGATGSVVIGEAGTTDRM